VLAVLIFYIALGICLALLGRMLRRRSVTNPGEATTNASQQDMSGTYPTIQGHEIPHLLTTRWVQGWTVRIEQFVKQNALKLRKDVSIQLNQRDS
jgi:hypothetical protein